jgi:hypothetical protein
MVNEAVYHGDTKSQITALSAIEKHEVVQLSILRPANLSVMQPHFGLSGAEGATDY